ncbi:isochorismatase family protein [Rouxiella badensis]|jgi:nicotinamidase-related amidase|uniref:Isochorismatase n=1 Tax=Rouxiella badensis TaxID=1646377 RepID=A0A1X0WB78_9GAMM|nr:isochorismatase family protein [Rouxiella badensis]MCC3704801.1 isochorismatase family protein [Rouxiella badensis]MCC3720997.1 isochorismatase family protein [Rouxiella badensis]MCC3729554.1 isochorismatase family protein [Rouxiella badensis]MCC3735419.1 isochorismatase family protein [Rouxiella badensis]MCC3741222.1 isochorismatase family protein [Rouxiella badensis]
MNTLIVVDMQNGVFATPRFQAQEKIQKINALIAAADRVIFIQHECDGMMEGSQNYALLPDVLTPKEVFYVKKTACDAFSHTSLASLLKELSEQAFTICGCASDYCLDSTIKSGCAAGYRITAVADAHTTSERKWVSAEALINQHNEVWENFDQPGNPILVKPTAQVLTEWQS